MGILLTLPFLDEGSIFFKSLQVGDPLNWCFYGGFSGERRLVTLRSWVPESV